jgi:hypothetical protein
LKALDSTDTEISNPEKEVIRVLLLESYEEDVRIVERMLEEAESTVFTLKVCGSMSDAENLMAAEKFVGRPHAAGWQWHSGHQAPQAVFRQHANHHFDFLCDSGGRDCSHQARCRRLCA